MESEHSSGTAVKSQCTPVSLLRHVLYPVANVVLITATCRDTVWHFICVGAVAGAARVYIPLCILITLCGVVKSYL